MSTFDVTNPIASVLQGNDAPAFAANAPVDQSGLPPQNPISPTPNAPSAAPPTGLNTALATVPGGTAGVPTGQPSQPSAPAPRPQSFAAKLLSAVGSVLQSATNVGQQTLAASGDPTAVANQQRKQEQERYQAQQAKEAQAHKEALTQEQRIQQREDDEAAARIAESNVRMIAEKQASYRLGSEWQDKQIAQGQADLKSMSGAEGVEGLAQVVQHGITGDQAHQLLADNKLNPYEYHLFPTGKTVTGTDAAGNPTYDYTYDVAKVPETWTPTDDQIARIKTVPGYEKYQKGTVLPGSQVLSALTQAETIKTTQQTMKQAADDAKLAGFKHDQDIASMDFVKSGDWLKFLNANGGDPVKAAQHILADPAMSQKYTTSLYNDVMKQFATEKDPSGVSGYSTMLHQWQEDANNRLKIVTNNQGGSVGGTAMTDEMKANIASLPKDKQAVVAQYDAPTKSSLYSVAFGPGDVSIDAFPNRVSGKSGQLDRAHAEGVIKQLNPNWSEQQYKATQAAYKQVTFGQNGKDVETYNNLLDHMSNAQDIIEDSLRKNNPKFLNSAINLAENEGWGTEATKIQTALEPVKAEFSSLMANGHALHADQQALYNAMVNPAETPAQLEQAFKNFGATGVVRLLGLNDQYKKIAGKNVPGILRKDAIESAKHLGLDPKTMQQLGTLNSGDTLFHNPNWTPGTPEEQQQNTDTQQQQKQAAAEQAKAIAQQALATGKAPNGTTGIGIGPDGNYWYHDQQNKMLGRVQ